MPSLVGGSLRLAFLLLLAVAGFAAGDDAPRQYRLGVSPAVPWSPAHVAAALTRWRDLGVAVRVVDHIGEEEHRSAVTHRLVDLAIDRVGGLIALQQSGVPMTLLGEVGWSADQERFVGRDSAGPGRAASIGVSSDDPAVLGFLDGALRRRGLTLADVAVDVLKPQDLAGHYIQGRLDWLVCPEPFASDVLARGAHLLATPSDLPGCMPVACGGRADVVAAIPRADLVLIFVGWIQATRWMADPANAKAGRSILVDRTLVDPRDAAAVAAITRAVADHDAPTLAERNRPEGALLQSVLRTAALLAESKRLVRPIDAAAMIDTSALREALGR